MAKTTRLKADAFDWVQDTSKTTDREGTDETAEQPPRSRRVKAATKAAAKRPKKATLKKAADETEEGPSRPIVLSAAKNERVLYVKFIKRSGEIVAMQEFFLDREHGLPWTGMPDDQNAAEILLIGELATKKLIDIHENYRVTKSGETVRLVRKA